MEAMIHGIVLAFGLILPLGVQNVFVFNQGALQPTYLRALPVVITAALCDTILILLAVLGLSLLLFGSVWLKTILIGAGFLFLLYMGWVTWNSKPGNDFNNVENRFTVKKQILFASSVSLLNPHAIMDTIGVIGTSSLNYEGTDKILFTVSCIVVSWVWFASLALAGKWFGKLDKSGKILRVFNKISAIVMWAAAWYLIRGIL
jgi:L-lysine exporter family protein LysE/ArgO